MNRILLNQALHGYGDGHQLLGISAELSRDQLRQLRVMSDLAGPAFRTGFDGYLTGFPLVGGSTYALSRTWYATEMPRSGCVWTHTLLIDVNNLVDIPSAFPLTSLFQRPHADRSYQEFEQPIEWVSARDEDGLRVHIDTNLAASIAEALYGGEGAVVVALDEGGYAEDTVLALWSQQWPALRSNLRFCTGSLAPRDLAFDLVVSPPETARSIRDNSRFSVISLPVRRTSWDAWIDIIVSDLNDDSSQSDFRSFLWKFGGKVGKRRTGLALLSDLFISHQHWKDGTDAINHTLSVLADAPALGSIRAELVALFFDIPPEDPLFSAVVGCLLEHPGAWVVPREIASMEEKAKALARLSPSQALSLAQVAARTLGEHGEPYLVGIAHFLSNTADGLRDIQLSLLASLLRAYPELALESTVWNRSPDEQRVLFDKLDHEWVINHTTRLIITIVAAQAWEGLRTFVNRFTKIAVESILDETEFGKLPASASLASLLQEHQQEVATALAHKSRSGSGIWLAAAVIDPRSRAMKTLAASAFSGLKSQDEPGDRDVALLAASTFLVAALSSQTGVGLRLLRPSFSLIYRAEENSQIQSVAWPRIEPFLPWNYPEWDHCARLLKAVVEKVVDADDFDQFVEIFSDIDLFRRAIETADWSWSGRRFIKSLRRASRIGGVNLDPHFVDALGDEGWW